MWVVRSQTQIIILLSLCSAVIDELSEKAVKEIRKEKIRREWKEKRQKEIQQREQRQKEYDDVYSDVI